MFGPTTLFSSEGKKAQKMSATPSPPASPKAPPPQNLFHFAECTNCRHILPLSTDTEKYFAVLAKDPSKKMGLGVKCMRCGADSWVLAK
jgi:hypothetical protein